MFTSTHLSTDDDLISSMLLQHDNTLSPADVHTVSVYLRLMARHAPINMIRQLSACFEYDRFVFVANDTAYRDTIDTLAVKNMALAGEFTMFYPVVIMCAGIRFDTLVDTNITYTIEMHNAPSTHDIDKFQRCAQAYTNVTPSRVQNVGPVANVEKSARHITVSVWVHTSTGHARHSTVERTTVGCRRSASQDVRPTRSATVYAT
jgi:hypothetical protein